MSMCEHSGLGFSGRLRANISDGLPVCLEQDMPVHTHSKQGSLCCTDRLTAAKLKWTRVVLLVNQSHLTTTDQLLLAGVTQQVNMASGQSRCFTRWTGEKYFQDGSEGRLVVDEGNRRPGLSSAAHSNFLFFFFSAVLVEAFRPLL